MTEDFFGVLGVRPVLGPGFPRAGIDDPSLATVAVIGHALWESVLGGTEDVIGRRVLVNDVPVTVVGVAPPRFRGLGAVGDYKLWLPAESRHVLLPPSVADRLHFGAVARLRPGVTLDGATAATQVIAARAGRSHADRSTSVEPPAADAEDRAFGAEVVRTMNGDPNFERDVRRLVLSFGGLALLVLLITCTNVSALLMGLAMARRHEIVVRLSLGASRRRLVRQLLTESSFLSLLASAAALGLAAVTLRLVAAYLPAIPLQLAITWPAAWFALGAALLVGVGFGLAPALHATRAAFQTALQDSAAAITGSRLRLQRVLVVAQVALTQPLVVGVVATVLFVYANLRPASSGDLADRILSVQLHRVVSDPWSVDPEGVEERRAAEMERLAADLAALAGVTAVAPSAVGGGELGPFEPHPDDLTGGADGSALTFVPFHVSTDHFAVHGVPLLRGRALERGDRDALDLSRVEATVPVVVPSDVARHFWAGAGPIGRRVRPVGAAREASATLEVVGVVPTPDRGGRFAGDRQIYLLRDTTEVPRALTLRTEAEAEPLLPAVRRIAMDAAPTASVSVETLAALHEGFWVMFRRVTAGLFAAGALTLLLSAIGLYAVVAFAAGQRRREIAVRMALGARGGRVAMRVLGSGLELAGVGLAIGLPISLLAVHVWNRLPDPSIPDVSMARVAICVATLVIGTAVVASWLPSRRAAAVDPAAVLRSE